eukprot:TRINITY_DN787_c0_g1_i1.p1 TRINITY_DN787_c0_g1~~TRINITY_DN787_c0_g1_i1.p1  ORF type:complete len:410 (+),score=111.89 TRINITY_DN787_c0_g1_i1:62-1291(+)
MDFFKAEDSVIIQNIDNDNDNYYYYEENDILPSTDLLIYVFLAGVAPLIAALVPIIVSKRSKNKTLSPRFTQILLGLSAGLLFAVATIDLIPEALNIAQLDTNTSHNTETEGEDDLILYENLEEEIHHNHHHHHHGGEAHQHVENKMGLYGIGCGFLLLFVIEQALASLGLSHSHSPPSFEEDELNLQHNININSNKNKQLFQRNSLVTDDPLIVSFDDIDKKKDKPHNHHNHDHHHNHDFSSSFGLLGFIGLAVHSFVDGLVISGAWQAGSELGTNVAIALLLHKFPDGFLLSSLFLGSPNTPSSSLITDPDQKQPPFLLSINKFWFIILVCSMTPIGAFSGWMLLEGLSASTLSFVLGFGAGTFLFISCTTLLPEIMHLEENRAINVISIVGGYVLFVLTDTFFHAH